MPDCCSAAARRRTPPTCSSTRWCRTPPTAPCCAGGGRNCTRASPRRWKQHFADLVERQPELLAHHLTAAGDTERAVDQWLKAGQHAAARSAYLEAIAHFERGLGLLHSLPESPDRDGREIELQLALAGCLLTAKGAAAAKLPYMRALDSPRAAAIAQQRFEALYGVWQSTNMSGGSAAASPLSARLLSMTEREGDDGLRLQAHHSAWATLAFAGDPAKTREHTDAGRLLYDPEKHASHRFVYGGHDPGACADYWALRPNGCSAIPRRRSQASPILSPWRSGSPTRSR